MVESGGCQGGGDVSRGTDSQWVRGAAIVHGPGSWGLLLMDHDLLGLTSGPEHVASDYF